MTRSQIKEYIESQTEDEILLVDDLDEAFIGLTEDINQRAVYSVDKIIQILSNDMTQEEAWEYFDYNIASAYLGEKTPIFIKTIK
jgi:hypothetical protein